MMVLQRQRSWIRTPRFVSIRALSQRISCALLHHCAAKCSEKALSTVSARYRRPFRRRGLSNRRCATTITLVCVILSGAEIRNGTSNAWARLLPRVEKAFRRHYLTNWKLLMKKARDQPQFRAEDVTYYSYVISIPRTRGRSWQTIHSLQEHEVLWRYYDGFDGLAPLDMGLVNTYAGVKKQRRLRATSHIGHSELVELKRNYDNSLKIPKWVKQSIHERLRFGCFMSHVLLWNDALRLGLPFAIVLEDDAVVRPNFTSHLMSRLNRLPLKWDFLFLNGCFVKLGPTFDVGLRQSRGGLCTYAYAISANGIRHLQLSILRSDKPIDHVIDEEVLHGRLLAFHADPPLADISSSIRSTLSY